MYLHSPYAFVVDIKVVVPSFMVSKGKGHPTTGHECPEVEYRYSSTVSLTSALDGFGWSTPRPSLLTPGKDPVPIVWEAGWAPGPFMTSVLVSMLHVG